jgi:hypothetical protein
MKLVHSSKVFDRATSRGLMMKPATATLPLHPADLELHMHLLLASVTV